MFDSSSETANQSLDGVWKIATDAGNVGKAQRWFERAAVADAREANVPDVLERTFPGYDGVVWYWKEFESPRVVSTERLQIRFGAADYYAEAWLNGKYLGAHEGGETPFVFDVTRQAMAGHHNLLVVRVLNPGRERIDGMVLEETPHGIKNAAMRVGNFWNPGGLWQSVELRRVGALRVEDLFVQARRGSGAVDALVRVVNDTAAPRGGKARLEISEAASGAVLCRKEREIEIPKEGTTVEMGLNLAGAREWSFAEPHLYRVTATVEADEYRDAASVRTGFRDFVFRDGFFRLNGRRIFLKETHSVGHFPIGQHVPADRELLRRELIYAKAMGFNMVRWLGRTMFPSQLDFCDELGLLVYQESYASWNLRDSPELGRRFDFSVREMILRDRNHPSVVTWGLLNETLDNPAYRHATGMLPLIRAIDPGRLVMLSSGRWDGQFKTGSISNPGSMEWEPLLGIEGPGAPNLAPPDSQREPPFPGYRAGSGDIHYYPPRPWGPEHAAFMRTAGAQGKNVFISEYGNGSQMDAPGLVLEMQQNGARADYDDYRLFDAMREQLERDWRRWGLDKVFASPREMARWSHENQTEQRRVALAALRSNPHLAGYGLTGLSDQACEGEGLMTLFRELKPGIVDVMSRAFAPAQWCIFTAPHVYSGASLPVEAVLVNEDALPAGSHPVRLRVAGPEGIVFEKTAIVEIPEGEAPGFVIPVFKEEARLDGPAGEYVVEVAFDRGSAVVGRERVIAGDRSGLPRLSQPVKLARTHSALEELLAGHGAETGEARRIFVPGGDPMEEAWRDAVENGATAVLIEPASLPQFLTGKVVDSAPLYWGRDDLVKPHPIFAGLPSRCAMDLRFYRDIIARKSIVEFGDDAENAAPAFAVAKPGTPGYWAASNLLIYRHGKGRVIVTTMRLLTNIGTHPAADRVLLNMAAYSV